MLNAMKMLLEIDDHGNLPAPGTRFDKRLWVNFHVYFDNVFDPNDLSLDPSNIVHNWDRQSQFSPKSPIGAQDQQTTPSAGAPKLIFDARNK